MRKNNRRRGLTFLEVLIAGIVIAIAVVGMFSAYTAVYAGGKNVSQMTQAEEIAKAIIETARVYGPANIPTGTYSHSTSTGSWTGSYSSSGGWTTNSTAYYNWNGVQVASASATGAFFSAQISFSDSNVLVGTGTTYSVQNNTLRSMVVTVKTISSGSTVYVLATNLINDGA